MLARADGRARACARPGRREPPAARGRGPRRRRGDAHVRTRDRAVRLDCGLADIAIERGVMTPRVLFVDTRDTILTAQGTVDLSDRATRAARARRAARLLSAHGSRLRSTCAAPSPIPPCRSIAARVAGTVIASVVLGALVSPVAALLPLLDFGEGDPPSPCGERYAGAGGACADVAAPRPGPAPRDTEVPGMTHRPDAPPSSIPAAGLHRARQPGRGRRASRAVGRADAARARALQDLDRALADRADRRAGPGQARRGAHEPRAGRAARIAARR